MADYKDIRQDFWRTTFSQALDWQDYLQAGEEKHRNKWLELEKLFNLDAESVKPLTAINRPMNVLVYTGIWCGDCVRQGPMFQEIAKGCPQNINLRFIERIDDSPLADELRINGALKVPVVVFLSEDFYELGRFGDRLLSTYRRKAETELGATCASGIVAPKEQELAVEIAEWVDVFERMLLILRLAPALRKKYND